MPGGSEKEVTAEVERGIPGEGVAIALGRVLVFRFLRDSDPPILKSEEGRVIRKRDVRVSLNALMAFWV